MSDLVFESQSDAALVESVGSSTVSKSLKINKPRSFNVVGFSTRSVWFHK
ncbi:general secretion pathway protein GspH [Vibrio cholerae]|nr:general secretion pathway protein GspH [Vibrio cholerae]MBO1390686.1 general secretion pathway protein GspH [Vibrio cholerae]MBO1398141.1 general secretion pathway protein GspH [Vibrio cholerae]